MNASVNADQTRAWNANEGDSWIKNEEHFNATSRRHTKQLKAGAAVAADDNVLDIGCGCGETTRDFARLASSGATLGIDLSNQMVERARERSRAEGLTNVTFEVADAQVHPFDPEGFSVATSRFGVMFFDDPVAAFVNIRRGLRRDARLALLVWQELARNEWLLAIRKALAAGRDLPAPPAGAPGPFGLADPARVRTILTEAGFRDIDLADVDEPVELGSDADDAYNFFSTTAIAQGMTADLDDDTKAGALAALKQTMTEHDTGEGVLFDSRAWLITATNP